MANLIPYTTEQILDVFKAAYSHIRLDHLSDIFYRCVLRFARV